MPLPRIYRLRGDDTRVVLHKEFAVFLGFTDSPLREARHELEMVMRPHMGDNPWPAGARFVLKNMEFADFNKEVFADYGERLKGKQATLYTSIGVKFILDLLTEKAVRATGPHDNELVKTLANRGIPIARPVGVTSPLPFPVQMPPSGGPVTTPSSTLPTGEQLAISLLTFDGDQLECTVVGNEPYVSLPSLCRPFAKRVDAQTRTLRWARTHLGWVRDGASGASRNVTLLHAQDVPMFIARMNQRGMTPGLKVKHDQYVRHCAIVLAEHFKLLRTPASVAAPAMAAPAAQTTQVMAPVATLSAVMIALTGWVKEGKLSADVADRYVVDYMQRNGVLDFTIEPPPLPEVFLIKGRAPVHTTNGNGPSVPFKAGVRGPFKTAASLLADVDKRCGGLNRTMLHIDNPESIDAVARDLNIFEHSFWGRYTPGNGWEYDQDGCRKILEEVTERLQKFQNPHAHA